MLNQYNNEVHLDQAQFVSAIQFTAAQTGFQPELIEKDYFCSLVLIDIAKQLQDDLIFKGGTLLAKAHAGFYRLSEDLDFSISVSSEATRKERSKLATPIKEHVNSIPNRLTNVDLEKELTGSDESRQYNGEITYTSCLAQKKGRILIEIGLREEVISISHAQLKTLLLNPLKNEPFVSSFNFNCLSQQEAYAEKMRAALTRQKVAIRDFYDLDYAIKKGLLNTDDQAFVALVKRKLVAPNAFLIEFDAEKVSLLQSKINTELLPTLNQSNGINFNLNEVISMLKFFRKSYLE